MVTPIISAQMMLKRLLTRIQVLLLKREFHNFQVISLLFVHYRCCLFIFQLSLSLF